MYEKAVEQGYANAQFSLGLCYASGIGVDRDEQKAVELYKMAAERGNIGAKNYLEVCYYKKRGIKK